MAAEFSVPIQRALDRTRTILFDGFDPAKYLILGFSAFLALLVDGMGDTQAYAWSSTRSPISSGLGLSNTAWSGFRMDPSIWLWLGPAIGCTLLLAVALLYVGAHGKMIFLENAVYDRAAIVEPWGRLDAVSNSLFLWMLAFSAVGFVVFAALGTPWFFVMSSLADADGIGKALGIPIAIFGGLILFVIGLAFAFVWFLCSHFVVPILYRNGGSAFAAWGKFLPLFRREWFGFLVYGLLYFCFRILLGAVVLVLTVATCCLLGIVMLIPYVSTLVILPAVVFVRLFGVEFLAQFGEEFEIEPLV